MLSVWQTLPIYSVFLHFSVPLGMFKTLILQCAQRRREDCINIANEISASVYVCNAQSITNGVINTPVAGFFVWLYWNKL